MIIIFLIYNAVTQKCLFRNDKEVNYLLWENQTCFINEKINYLRKKMYVKKQLVLKSHKNVVAFVQSGKHTYEIK